MKNFGLFTFLFLTTTSCLPAVHLIDRPTVMEEEAAGDWPDFEVELKRKNLSHKPYPLPPSKVKSDERRSQQGLPGEYNLDSKKKTN